jgi:hypothetical protein
MLATVPCIENVTLLLQDALRPVIKAIVIKAADPNRRVSSRSLLALEELCRGQDGELAVGSATETTKNSVGYGGLPFIVSCAVGETDMGHSNWQWWQGRLVLLDMLLSKFPFSFQLPADMQASTSFQELNSRLCVVLQFATEATHVQHMRVTKLARRVFVRSVRFGAHIPEVVQYMKQLIDSLQDTHRTTLSRRLSLIVGESSRFSQNSALKDTSISSSFQASSLPSLSLSLTPLDMERVDQLRDSASNEKQYPCEMTGHAGLSVTEEKRLLENVFSSLSHNIPLTSSTTNAEAKGPPCIAPPVQSELLHEGTCKDVDVDEVEAVVQAMEASQSDSHLPVLSGLAPPDDLVTVHVQEGADGASQGQRDGSNFYVEGIHWKKGARIGTGAFCTCFLARDIKTGALMALKQVHYCV